MDHIVLSRGIFGARTSSPTSTPSRLRSETEDFNVSESLMESLIIMEESFFHITRDHMMATHIYLKEGNEEILQEGFNDFIKSAADFFKRMAEKFKEFMSKVFMYIHALFGNFENFLTKYKDQLSKLDPDFAVQGYTYTFDDKIPQTDKVRNIVAEYNSELSQVTNRTKQEILDEQEEFTSDAFLSSMRGYVLGTNASISSEDYAVEARKIFRDGVESPSEIKVTKSTIDRIMIEYSGLKKTFKECAKDRDKTLLLVESLKTFFNRSVSVHYKGSDNKVMYAHNIEINKDSSGINRTTKEDIVHSTDNLDKVNTFYNYKWTQAKEIGFATVTAMTEKVNALKEALRQSEQILRKCIFASKKSEEVKAGE